MKVVIRNPQHRELELSGQRRVGQLIDELDLNPESVIVVRGDELLTRDDLLRETDTVEIISAISGG
jgi:sulfur carrier protein